MFYQVVNPQSLSLLIEFTYETDTDTPEMPQNRNTVRNSLVIRPDLGQRLRNDKDLKILIYCRETHDPTPHPTVDIKFPNQIEIKVNNIEVKHNFKGLKNKPGSTKPADITALLQKYSGQDNSIHITYALTTKRFSYGIYLARYVSADKLVDRIKAGNFIPKDKTLQKMMKSNAESDIVATSVRLSLKDPVSTVRIALPVRSSHCEHSQCFDGAMFLQLQEQAPQWNCPVCSKHVAFESLCVDKYFEDILNRTSATTEKVEIEPTGEWRPVKEDDESDNQANGTTSKKRAAYDDDFDDLIELDEPVSKPVNGLKRESFQLPSLSPMTNQSFPIYTPPLSSREASVAQSASSAQRPGNKRPQSTVIDLTLSDEDEDEPPRPAKRQSTIQSQRQTGAQSNSYNTPTSLPDPRLQPPPPQPHQHQQNYSTSNLGQANAYRSAQYPPPNSTATTTQQQRRQSYNTPNALNLHPHNSLSPSIHTPSPFSPHPPSPAWPQHPRPATVQHAGYQHQQQQQSTSLFPPPSASFPIRPPSAPSAQNTQSNSSSAMHSGGGLRLPPLQMMNQTSSNNHTSSFSPAELPQDSFTGWRDAGAFGDDWDFGSFGSNPA